MFRLHQQMLARQLIHPANHFKVATIQFCLQGECTQWIFLQRVTLQLLQMLLVFQFLKTQTVVLTQQCTPNPGLCLYILMKRTLGWNLEGKRVLKQKEEYQGQAKRKRIRRKKQKTSLQNSNNVHGEQTESGMQETLVQDNLQLQQIDSPKISKNKKRKMKKKRQKEKMRAAGLVTKTAGVDFTYQPDKNNTEEAAGLKDIDKKADSILDFLQATQQIYFADSKSECTDSAVDSAAAQELLQYLESRTISSSDVTLLHQLKSLVLLQDIERLKDALKQFQEQSMMRPDHTKIVTSLFHYWITDILPVKNRK
ncbi:glutamate-rich protein 1 isoform X2 [Grus americana]|uniref:glutamate-rich protein 1 isoform X2 n=1 Tax=Grus americana TaxID=9117 RepID=UPI0024077AC5|nr:glutamate-rich protein 1 isoform X2 [Grus americana]